MKFKKTKILLLTGLCFFATACNRENVVTPQQITFVNTDIQGNQIDLEQGKTLKLNIELSPSNSEATILWSSSEVDVATVSDEGLVTAKKEGTSIITAKVKDAEYISKSIFVKVIPSKTTNTPNIPSGPVNQDGTRKGENKENPLFPEYEGNDPLEIYFIEMQHIYADALFIKKGNIEIMIDSGYAYDGNFVKEFIEQHMSDNRLELLMATHSDGDHIDGFNNSIKAIESVSMMIDYGGVGSGGDKAARDKFISKGTIYHSAIDCINHENEAYDRYYLTSDFYFDVLNTGNYIKNSAGSAGNANSLALLFYYKDFKFFTAGDLTSASESSLIKNEVNLPEVTLYKASHHGSHGSNSQALLDKLNPKGVAISAARAGQYNATPGPDNKNNTYNLDAKSGHPAAAAIERIYKAPNISNNLNVYWNAVNGTMKFQTNGEDSFTFTGSPTMRGYYDLTLTNGTPVWNENNQCYENKVTGEENKKLHETKAFVFRDYIKYLPAWAQKEYFNIEVK